MTADPDDEEYVDHDFLETHVDTFCGLPVVRFDPDAELPADPSAVAWRLETEETEVAPEVFEQLVERWLEWVPPASVQALIVGEWGSAYEMPPPLELLCRLGSRLTGLWALFLGELTQEQCEISWLTHGDITPLFAAYPQLAVLWIRGGQGLRLAPVRHERLVELVIQSGGLPREVVRAIGESDLPALKVLQLWLGVAHYGGDVRPDDLAGILGGGRLPALRNLGLCNAEAADEIAAAVAHAPVVGRLDTLDLSRGTLGEAGAHALLAGQPLTHLGLLDLHHHYVPFPLAERIIAELPDVDVDLSDEQVENEFDGALIRYTLVSE